MVLCSINMTLYTIQQENLVMVLILRIGKFAEIHQIYNHQTLCYSGTSIIRTPLGPHTTVLNKEVSLIRRYRESVLAYISYFIFGTVGGRPYYGGVLNSEGCNYTLYSIITCSPTCMIYICIITIMYYVLSLLLYFRWSSSTRSHNNIPK